MARSFPYLSRTVVEATIQAAQDRGVSQVATSSKGFGRAYLDLTDAELHELGPSKYPKQTWAQRRDGFIARHMAQARAQGEPLWTKRGTPTRRHLALAVWAYSPWPRDLEKWLRVAGYLPH